MSRSESKIEVGKEGRDGGRETRKGMRVREGGTKGVMGWWENE